jgi:ABC-type proline/glycine betaine transport system permease subunit
MATPARTVTDVLQDIMGNVQEIIRAEFRLAKAETKEKVRTASGPATMLGVGALIGIYGLGFVLLAAMYALSKVVVAWVAALIVGVALAITAAILVSTGKKALKRISPVPEKTVQSVKENVQWSKDQIR